MMRKLFITFSILSLFITICAFGDGERFIYNSKNKRDPFLSLVTPSGYILDLGTEFDSADLKVEGIVFDPITISIAIVNGRVVQKGDRIGNFQVLEILENRITFINTENKEKIEIRLKKEAR